MGVSLVFSGEAINQDRLRDFRKEFYEKHKDKEEGRHGLLFSF